jgi:hypothetical protein
MAEKTRATYSVTEPTRKLLARLSGELRVPMSEVFTEAVTHYLDTLDAGTETVPEGSLAGNVAKVPRLTVYPEKSARDRLSDRAAELRVPLGRLIMGALAHYQKAIESGRIPKPAPTLARPLANPCSVSAPSARSATNRPAWTPRRRYSRIMSHTRACARVTSSRCVRAPGSNPSARSSTASRRTGGVSSPETPRPACSEIRELDGSLCKGSIYPRRFRYAKR